MVYLLGAKVGPLLHQYLGSINIEGLGLKNLEYTVPNMLTFGATALTAYTLSKLSYRELKSYIESESKKAHDALQLKKLEKKGIHISGDLSGKNLDYFVSVIKEYDASRSEKQKQEASQSEKQKKEQIDK
ncbi:MAG: hypothetical protein Q8N63_07855, partial [Nanoarchaeota archaeon]|nr:hypothetical protein [Nanoarchaeota archaeon]